MSVQTIMPENRAHWLELRTMGVTSTESAALFGVSPYLTDFELYHQKLEKTPVEIEPSERMKWGSRLQSAIAAGIAEDHGLEAWRPMPEFMFDPGLKMGASFDFALGKEGLLEVKNVDSLAFRDGWLETENGLEAPLHIELQVQHQLAVSGRKFAYIGALLGGNRTILLKREADPKAIDSIKNKVAAFWKSIDQKIEPKPDFSRDAEFIAKLCGFSEKDKIFDARGDRGIAALVADYREVSAKQKELETKRDEIKARLLKNMGSAEKLLGDGFTVSAGMVAGAQIAFERKPYRMFKVNFQKEKKS